MARCCKRPSRPRQGARTRNSASETFRCHLSGSDACRHRGPQRVTGAGRASPARSREARAETPPRRLRLDVCLADVRARRAAFGTSIAVQGRVWVFEYPSPKVGTESEASLGRGFRRDTTAPATPNWEIPSEDASQAEERLYAHRTHTRM